VFFNKETKAVHVTRGFPSPTYIFVALSWKPGSDGRGCSLLILATICLYSN